MFWVQDIMVSGALRPPMALKTMASHSIAIQSFWLPIFIAIS